VDGWIPTWRARRSPRKRVDILNRRRLNREYTFVTFECATLRIGFSLIIRRRMSTFCDSSKHTTNVRKTLSNKTKRSLLIRNDVTCTINTRGGKRIHRFISRSYTALIKLVYS